MKTVDKKLEMTNRDLTEVEFFLSRSKHLIYNPKTLAFYNRLWEALQLLKKGELTSVTLTKSLED